jgi:hypothetical protein
MDVEAEDEVGAGDQLQILDDLMVARVGIDLLGAPVGEGMRGAGNEDKLVIAGQLDHLAAQFVDVLAGLVNVFAHARAHFNDRGVHLRLDALLEAHLAGGQHLGFDVGAQVARDRIDGLVLLFDAQGERRPHAFDLAEELARIVAGARADSYIPDLKSETSGTRMLA